MSAERAPFGERKHEFVGIAGFAGDALRLKDRVLLRTKGRLCDVLRRLEWKPELARAVEERFFLEAERCGLHRQRSLDPFVVRNQIAVAKREQGRHAEPRRIWPVVGQERGS